MSTSTLPANSGPKYNEHLQDLRRDVGALANDVKSHATGIKDDALDRLQDTKNQASAQLNKAKDSAVQLIESSRSFLSEHPLTAIGVGVVLGMILASRWRKAD